MLQAYNIGRKILLFFPCPVREKMFALYMTSLTGLDFKTNVLFSTHILSLTGQEKNVGKELTSAGGWRYSSRHAELVSASMLSHCPK